MELARGRTFAIALPVALPVALAVAVVVVVPAVLGLERHGPRLPVLPHEDEAPNRTPGSPVKKNQHIGDDPDTPQR